MFDVSEKIKLVIWDLDETFWKGTLSEEGVKVVERNVQLIKHLNLRGIVNSICSKNDFDFAKKKLIEIGVWDQFVFPKISWLPKGKIIEALIDEMSLRPDNVLFLDDNIMNLEEVKFVLPNINLATPDYIESLWTNPFLLGKDDAKLSRLNQYKVLELKSSERLKMNSSNYDFLKQSEIRVNILDYTQEYFDRVAELVGRTNQLNFTQIRPSQDELINQLNESENYVVEVQDKYGEYGIVGFISIADNCFKHFLFSCRTMNMGVENYVLQYFDKFDTSRFIKPVQSNYINLDFINDIQNSSESTPFEKSELGKKALLIGSCDLDQTAYYYNDKRLVTRFNTVNSYGLDVRFDHTDMLLDYLRGYSDLQLESIRSLPFTPDFEDNSILTADSEYLILSLLTDYSRGVYRHKTLNYIVAYEHYNNNLIEMARKSAFPKHLYGKEDFFHELEGSFTFEGVISPERLVSNIKEIATLISPRKLILINGAEIDKDFRSEWEFDTLETHKKLNSALDMLEEVNISLIDVRKIVTSNNLITDNLRHYTKEVYKLLADEIAKELCDIPDLARSKRAFRWINKILAKLSNAG